MPATVELRHSSITTTGYQDGLGRRSVRFDRELGATLECLHLRPELMAYEDALLAQACAISALADPQISRIRSIDREHGRLVVISEQPRGDRLAEILDARNGDTRGGVEAAFGFLLHTLPSVAKLHAASLTHGAIAPGRIMVDAFSPVVLADAIFGAVLPRLNLSERRLWHQLELVYRPQANTSCDVAQLALCSLYVAHGRRIHGDDPHAGVRQLLEQLVERASTEAGERCGGSVRDLFTAMLAPPARGAAISAAEALARVRDIATGTLGEQACTNAFVGLVCQEVPDVSHVVSISEVAETRLAETPRPVPIVVELRADDSAGLAPEPPTEASLPRTMFGFAVSEEASDPGNRMPAFFGRVMTIVKAAPPRLRLAAAAVVVIALGAVAGRSYLQGDAGAVTASQPAPAVAPEEPAPTTAAATTGALTVESKPAGAKVIVDGVHAGQTPLRLDSLAPGRHTVTLVNGKVLTRRSVRIEAGQTALVDFAALNGWLTIQSPVALDVSIKGRVTTKAADGRIQLPAGRHVVTVNNAALGYSSTHTVEVSGGEEASIKVAPTGRVNLNAQPWAEVWIDGARAGETPLANLQVPLGPREFVFRHPQYGERKITATVSTNPTALTVDFTKPAQRP